MYLSIRSITISLVFLLSTIVNALYAQLTVNSAATTNQMLQSLIGSGLTVSNVTINCAAGAFGTFSNGNTTNLGINSGIVLTSGTANAGGPASTSISQCWGTTSNDPDLTALDPLANNDVCIMEFDIIPACDTLSIRFVFGSDEYPTFVGSINDLFGFFITGPNPSGPAYAGQNIAVLPTPPFPFVSINNVNNGNTNTGPCTNCAYYIDNSAGTTIQYNGMTTVITSKVAMVPCQTYHFKIAIADASDCILDSGVFIDFLQCSSAYNYTTQFADDQCNSCVGTATVNMSGGIPPYTYQWLPTGGNGPTATNLCAGTYSVLVTDQAACGVPDTAIITIGNIGSISATAAQADASCFGDCNGSITVTPQSGTPPYTYTWTPNVSTSNTANGLCAGNYSVDVVDAGGCQNTFTYTITQPTQLTLSLAGIDSICAGDIATINATTGGGTGPYTVSWDNNLPNGNSQSVSPTQTTIYTATLTDANGCNIQQTFTVNITPSPTAAFTAGAGDCAPAIVNFTDNSNGATSYLWNFGDPNSGLGNFDNQPNPIHTYNQPGSYDVTLVVSNAGGCSDTLIVSGAVDVYPIPTAGLVIENPVVSELAPEVLFTDQSAGGTNCVIYFGDGDSLNTCNFGTITHVYPSAGTYTVTLLVANANGCMDTITLTVVVEEETTLYVPNAFTPNSSGNNDIFYAYGTKVEDFHMYIFDRWGNLIFESKDINKGWDGTYKNNPCQEDVYVWKITYSDQRRKRYKVYGHVSLIR